MNKILGITAILMTAMFAASVLATVDPTGSDYVIGSATLTCNSNPQCPLGDSCVNNVCVLTTCGITASALSPASFLKDGNPLLPGQDSNNNPQTTVRMTGNTAENLWIMGSPWSDGTDTMPIESTYWQIGLGGWNQLTGISTDTGTQVGPGSDVSPYFQLNVPTPQMTGTYTQTITFGTSC